MIEPPSKELMHILLENRLCTRSDLRRCRRRVRTLARDLPAFDSVWIDALQQLRRLTPFQAKLLQSTRASEIALGPCVLLDRLGSGLRATTYLARPRENRGQCVLKRLRLPPEALDAALSRLEELTVRLRSFSRASVVAPHTALRHNGELIAISRHVDGPNFEELTVRRGRFSAEAVTAVARELADGLAALEAGQAIHGDIRPANIRLTAAGSAVLVDAGLMPAVSPELIVDPRTSPERYDGIAPELIGTGAPADTRSDMYALGCLLWQLLAGRSPFPSGDPLARLAAHQTHRIVDVREWAPDTPAALAEAIHALTSPDPADRPASFRQFRADWGPVRRADRRRLARLHSSLTTRVPLRRIGPRLPAGFRKTIATAALCVLLAAVAVLSDADSRRRLLEATAPAADYLAEAAAKLRANRQPVDENAAGGRTDRPAPSLGTPLPEPDAAGIIALPEAGPYVWDTKLVSRGPIVIRGTGRRRPKLLVRPGRSAVDAERVTLENVSLHVADETTANHKPAIAVRSTSLLLRKCRLNSSRRAQPKPSTAADGSSPVFISWQAGELSESENEAITLVDCSSHGPADLLSVTSPPRLLECHHCLIAGGGRLLRSSNPPAVGRDCQVRMQHVTLRTAQSLLGVFVPPATSASGRFDLEVTNCVFDFDRQHGALFHLAGNLEGIRRPLIRMSGVGSLSRSHLRVATWVVNAATYSPLPDADRWVTFEGGILAAPFRFAGGDLRNPVDSAVVVQGIPRRASGAPGIDAARLSASRSVSAN